MRKKKKELKNKYWIAGIVVLALIVNISFAVNASQSLKSLIADKVGDRISPDILKALGLDKEEEEPEFGAFPGTDIYEEVRFHGGLISATAVEFDVTQQATSTEGDPFEAGSYCNNGPGNFVVRDWWINLKPNRGYGSGWTMGTTTRTADSSFTVTTSATLGTIAIATTSAGFFDRDTINPWITESGGINADYPNYATTTPGTFYNDNQGSATSTPFYLRVGDCFIVASDLGGATSSDSFVVDGGESGMVNATSTFHADVYFEKK